MDTAALVKEIARLQTDADQHVQSALESLRQADEAIKDLRKRICGKPGFVCDGRAWKIEHRAIGVVPGNRDWLLPNNDIAVVGE